MIVLQGSFVVDNFGDSLLLHLYRRWVREALPAAHAVSITRARPVISEQAFDRFGLLAAGRASGTVFVGGGYLGAPGSGELSWMLRNLRRHGPAALNAILRRIPITVNGVGAGPFGGRLGESCVRLLFDHASHATVRDTESLEELERIGVDVSRIGVSADAALSLTVESAVSLCSFQAAKDKPILVHLPCAANSIASGSIEEAVVAALRPVSDRPVLVVSDSNRLREDVGASSLGAKLLSRLPNAVARPYRGMPDMLSMIAGSSGVITSKLHVGIVSVAFGAPVIAVPTHSKVQRFYRQIGALDRCIPQSGKLGSHLPELVQALARGTLGPIDLSDSVRGASLMNRDRLHQFLHGLIRNPA